MRILYKPFSLIASKIAAKLGKTVFRTLWAQIDEGEPPEPTTPGASLGKIVGAKALEAATLAGIGAAVDRAGVRSFHYLTGIWPAKK